MRDRLASRLQSPSVRAGVSDALVVLVLVTMGAADLPPGADWRDPQWTLAIGLTAALLLGRRRAPLAVLAGVLALQAAVHAEQSRDDPAFQFFGTLVACYALGAHASLRRGIAGLVAVVAFFAVLNLSRGEGVDAAVFGSLLFLAAFAFGLIVRRASRRELALELWAERLEAERDERAREAVADERARIARDLHDAIGHTVSVMVLQIGAVRRRLTDAQGPERDALVGVERAGREAVGELRRMVGILRRRDDDALAPRPSLARVEELVETVGRAGVPVDLRIEGERDALPSGVDVSAYRILQEALTNVLKHAGDTQATVLIRCEAHNVLLEVLDEGGGLAGADRSDFGEGHGLIGMRERVALYGGSLEAGPREGGGFAVSARLPVDRTRA